MDEDRVTEISKKAKGAIRSILEEYVLFMRRELHTEVTSITLKMYSNNPNIPILEGPTKYDMVVAMITEGKEVELHGGRE